MKSRKGYKGKKDSLRTGRGDKQMRRQEEVVDTAERAYADARSRRDCYKSSSNDWAWYAQSPQLVKDYASFPFGKAVGSRINMGDFPSMTTWNNLSIPGIMALYFYPSVGNATDKNSPINVAARNIYSFVRHANSGHSNYDAPDLMMYLVAMDSIYMYHSYLKRVLGVIYDANTLNRYYPEAILTAMGVDPDDIRKHIVDLRGYINVFGTKVGSMCVPNSMSYMARHVWMTEGLYMDGTTSKSQTYMYVPAAFYRFRVNETTSVGELASEEWIDPFVDPSVFMTRLNTFENLVTFGDSLLNSVLSQEDFNIMSGDILKAFGAEGVVKVMGVTDGYMVLPTYNQEVLSQMENATVVNGVLRQPVTQNVAVGEGYIECPANVQVFAINPDQTATGTAARWDMDGITFDTTWDALCADRILNFHGSDVTPEMNMVATRLTNILTKLPPKEGTGTYSWSGPDSAMTRQTRLHWRYFTCETVGSELVGAALMFRYVWVGNSMSLDYTRVSYVQLLSTTGADAANPITQLSTFDWHPMAIPSIVTFTATSTYTQNAYPWGGLLDYDYFTVIDKRNLTNMATTALLSEFSVPQMGAFSNKLS